MPQLFCLKEPEAAAAATPRTLAGTVIVRTGLFCVGAQPPVGAACDGSAGAMSRPPAMATVEAMWRARITGPPRVSQVVRNVTAAGQDILDTAETLVLLRFWPRRCVIPTRDATDMPDSERSLLTAS